MWGIAPQSGLTTVVLDFTNELSPLILGLLAVIWFSAGVICWLTLQHYRTPKTTTVATSESTPDYRDAA